MATKTAIQLIDDLTGGPADETVPFSWQGVAYEIDLSVANATALRNALSDYVEHARRVPRRRGTVTPIRRGQTQPARVDREQNQAVRTWARRHGYQVSERGRIPTKITEAFHAAHGGAA